MIAIRQTTKIAFRPVAAAILLLSVASCGAFSEHGVSPRAHNNICAIFAERPDWYRAARRSYQKWSAPIEIQMAIIWRESSFRSRARPPRTYFAGFIPTGRQSSAYGYAQAIDSTWEWYLKDAGSYWSDRTDFSDAIDFVGWYMSQTSRINRIRMGDAYHQYLNYHEGQKGYRKGRWRNIRWLRNAARQVQNQAKRYRRQLGRCT